MTTLSNIWGGGVIGVMALHVCGGAVVSVNRTKIMIKVCWLEEKKTVGES